MVASWNSIIKDVPLKVLNGWLKVYAASQNFWKRCEWLRRGALCTRNMVTIQCHGQYFSAVKIEEATMKVAESGNKT